MGSSVILTISPHLLPHIDKALSPSYKAYALPKIPLPFRRIDESREQLSGVRGRYQPNSIGRDLALNLEAGRT